MFGFGNKKFLSEVCSIISDLGNIPLIDAQDFVEKNRDWVCALRVARIMSLSLQ